MTCQPKSVKKSRILDFFLLADTQLVMTTCDPAAYLEAYTFANRMLSTRIQLAGTIFSDRNIARSTRDLKPEVERHPNGLLARAIGQIVSQVRAPSEGS